MRNREAEKFFNNATEFEAGSDRYLLSSISKNGKYVLIIVIIRRKLIKILFFGFRPEAIKKQNMKQVNIQ